MRVISFILGALLLLAPMLVVLPQPGAARAHHGGAASVVTTASCPKGVGLTDFGGTPDDCQNATQNPSFQNVNFFSTGTGNARQSGQSAYYYNDATIPWNIPCIDNGCGYDTTQLTFDPANESASAQNASISSGVLQATSGNMGVIYLSTFYLNGAGPSGMGGGNFYPGQLLSTGTGLTSTGAHITSQIDATHWQTDNPSLNVASTIISGQQHPQINCMLRTVIPGYSNVPVIDCFSTGDATTASVFNGYDGSIAGAIYRFTPGSGAGADGKMGSITISNNKLVAFSNACNNTAINFTVGMHSDLHVVHNQHDGNFPTCTLSTFINSNNIGTSGLHQTQEFQWNAAINEPVNSMLGRGDYTALLIANNYSDTCNSPTTCGNLVAGSAHGAMYANSQHQFMDSYIYKHNTLLFTSAATVGSGTTSFSILAASTDYANAIVGDVEFLGNITAVNCQGGNCSTGSNVVQNCLWANNDPVAWGRLVSTSNLMDPTGCTVIYVGGASRSRVSLSGTFGYTSPMISILTVSNMNNDNWQPNSFIFPATCSPSSPTNCPARFNGTIVSNHNGTGTLTLDSPSSVLSSVYGIAGSLVWPGTYIVSKTDNSHYITANFYGTDDTHNTAVRQAMYTAYTVLDPQQVIDPATGQHPTGTGTNAGTYAIAIQNTGGAGGAQSNWVRFNPAIGSWPTPPTINDGTDRQLTDGSPRYLGSTIWNGGIAP